MGNRSLAITWTVLLLAAPAADRATGTVRAHRPEAFPHLSPGTHRFEARLLDAHGRPSGDPRVLTLRIPEAAAPPWTPASLGFLLAGGLFVAHRLRIGRTRAHESLRRQIAADLHDDIGSGLTEIALLSEVARRHAPPASSGQMATVAAQARGLRVAMSDIVWAVDPRRDRLADLVDRMRQAAFNMAAADAIHVDFAVPPATTLTRIDLSPERKRHLVLAFREAMTNVVRHAQARHVRAGLAVLGGRLVMTVQDDGRGFVRERAGAGMGLRSLQRRASEVGGVLEICSAPGRGTTVRLEIPLAERFAPLGHRVAASLTLGLLFASSAHSADVVLTTEAAAAVFAKSPDAKGGACPESCSTLERFQ